MRRVTVPCLDQNVSVLGFGCASLGSRISAGASQRAVFQALDYGVMWFDVAQAYGDGRAEDLLGDFLIGRRKDCVICSKIGFLPPLTPPAYRLARPLARFALGAVPGIRRFLTPLRPANYRELLDPKQIERRVAASLKRLRTDYLDVLALHDPTMDEVANSFLQEAVARIIEKGMARSTGVTGGLGIIRAAAAAGHSYNVVQFPDSPYDGAAACVRHMSWNKLPTLVTHGVFSSETIARLQAALVDSRQRTKIKMLATRYGIQMDQLVTGLLGRFAFASNPSGVVVISMCSGKHIKANVANASLPPNSPFVEDSIEVLLSA